MQNICNVTGRNSVSVSDIFIAAVQISMECEKQERSARYAKYLNSHWSKTYLCRYKVNQHLIVLDLYSVSINKILVTEYCGSFPELKDINPESKFDLMCQHSEINNLVATCF